MCDFNILYACQMDIETYNYIDDIFHLYRSGKLLEDKQGKKKNEAEATGMAAGFNAGVVFLPMTACPSYLTFKRDNADFMNNFFINIIARSFTDIEEFLQQQEENKDQSAAVQTALELKGVRNEWKQQLVQEVTEQFATFDTKIMEANQSMGAGGVRTTAKKVFGDEASYGITVKGKGGKDTNDIQDLVDM
jgi:hypothetical protein